MLRITLSYGNAKGFQELSIRFSDRGWDHIYTRNRGQAWTWISLTIISNHRRDQIYIYTSETHTFAPEPRNESLVHNSVHWFLKRDFVAALRHPLHLAGGALASWKARANALICMYIGRLESKLSSDLYTYKNRMTFVIRPFNLRRVRDSNPRTR